MPYMSNAAQGRRIVFVLAAVACVLQVALAPQISILGGRFNFMLAFSIAVALKGDASQAVIAGFFSGLFYDLTAAVPVGLMALLLTVSSFVLSFMGGAGTSGFSATSLRLSAAAAVAVCLVNGIALVILGSEGGLLVALGTGIVTGVLSAVASIPFLMASGQAPSLAGSRGSRPAFSGFSAHASRKGSRFKRSSSQSRGRKRFR